MKNIDAKLLKYRVILSEAKNLSFSSELNERSFVVTQDDTRKNSK